MRFALGKLREFVRRLVIYEGPAHEEIMLDTLVRYKVPGVREFVPTLSDGQQCLGLALMISGLFAKYCAAFELHMELVPDHRLLEFAKYSRQFSLSSPNQFQPWKKRACRHGFLLALKGHQQ